MTVAQFEKFLQIPNVPAYVDYLVVAVSFNLLFYIGAVGAGAHSINLNHSFAVFTFCLVQSYVKELIFHSCKLFLRQGFRCLQNEELLSRRPDVLTRRYITNAAAGNFRCRICVVVQTGLRVFCACSPAAFGFLCPVFAYVGLF